MNIDFVITTYNRPAMLKRCLDSLLAQTRSDWRAIIMDDNSDNPLTKQIIGNFTFNWTVWSRSNVTKEDRPLKCRYSVLINQARELVTSDLVMYLCDDVELTPHAVATILAHFEAHPDHQCGYVGQKIFRADFKTGEILGEEGTRSNADYGKPLGKAFCQVDHSQVVHRAKFYQHWNEDASAWHHADGLAFDQLIADAGPLYPIGDVMGDPLCHYYITDSSVCRQDILEALKKLEV